MSDVVRCGLCNRELGANLIEQHHLVPKTFKGKVTVPMHRICHQKIHATFAERDLANYYYSFERLLEHEEIIKFVKWVHTKPLGFYAKNNDTSERRKKRRS